MLFSGAPGEPGGRITIEANLATGLIRLIGTVEHAVTPVLEGVGRVMRI
jgi:hypothetical protein